MNPHAAREMLRNVNRALFPGNFSELTPVEDIRAGLIQWRDKALGSETFNPEAAVLLSHAIAHLARLQAADDAMRPQRKE